MNILKVKLFIILAFVLGSAVSFLAVPSISFASTNITSTTTYAWGDVLGWVNFSPTNGNVTVTDTALTGYAWSANYGWINLAPTNGGVVNDGRGYLTGKAWGANTGWIDFAGVAINSFGQFTGHTASSTLAGVINFSCANCLVTTNWRPADIVLPSTDATLSALSVDQGTLSPTFSSTTTSYTDSIPATKTVLHITTTTNDSNATVAINGSSTVSGTPFAVIIPYGISTSAIVITAQDGSTTNNYNITVTRGTGTGDTLSNLSPSNGSLSPTFSSSTVIYTESVPNIITGITFTPILINSNAAVTVNGVTTMNGSPSASVNLSVGTNVIPVIVSITPSGTSTIYTKTYTVTVTRTALPSISLTVPSSGATVAGSSVSLSATATDTLNIVGVQFLLDGTTNIGSLVTSTSSPNTYTTTWNSTGINSYGSHTIYAVAEDTMGNYATSSVTLNVDNVAPTMISAVYNSNTQITVALSKLANAYTITKSNSGGFTVTQTGSDTTYAISSIAPGSDNTHVVLTLADMTSAGASGVTVTYAAGENGTIADTLGNILATNNTSITIHPWNTTVPIISNITSNVSNGAYKAGAAIDIDLSFSKTVNSTGSVTVTLNTGGTCSVTISNSTVASCTYTVQSGDNSNVLNVSSVSGTITSTDGNAMTSFTPALNLSGNKSIIIDTTAPSVSLTVPSNGETVSGTSVALSATDSDIGSGIAEIQFKLDGVNISSSGTTNPYSIVWDSTSVTNDSHTLYAVAEDAAGNYATSSITVNVDNTVHNYTIGGSISGLTGNVVLQNNSGDNLTLSSNGSFTFNTSIANGDPYSVSVLTQPSGQTCSVSDGSGTVSSSNVTSVSVTCTTNSVAPAPTPTPTISGGGSSSGGGSVSPTVLTAILAPSASTTAYLNSLTSPVPGCPIGFTCTPIPSSTVAPAINPASTTAIAVFTRNLTVGMTGADVKRLQIFLNSQGFDVSKDGFGSPGQETTYFGQLTQKALAKFQKVSGIAPAAGYFGPITRGFINRQ